MTLTRLGLPRLVTALMIVAAVTGTLHARVNATADVGGQQQPAPTVSQSVVLLDRFEAFFRNAPKTGAAGYDSIQPVFSELMRMARQALADHQIDQQFFDRYARVLRVMLLASISDQEEILKPVTNPEFISFIRDVLGKNVDGPAKAPLGDFSNAVATEITNLRKLASGAPNNLSAAATGEIGSAPLRVGAGIKPPERTKYVVPEYPAAARSAKVQGTVIIETTIGKDGHVVNTKVLKPAPMLDEAAVAAVKQWEYVPTTVNGVPVEIVMVVTVSFNLK